MLKVEMSEPKKERVDLAGYQCLGKSFHSEVVVLFYAEGCGVVVAPDGTWPAGRHSTTWVMNSFTPFKGKMTLSNETAG